MLDLLGFKKAAKVNVGGAEQKFGNRNRQKNLIKFDELTLRPWSCGTRRWIGIKQKDVCMG
jgi:hypothetical protein